MTTEIVATSRGEAVVRPRVVMTGRAFDGELVLGPVAAHRLYAEAVERYADRERLRSLGIEA